LRAPKGRQAAPAIKFGRRSHASLARRFRLVEARALLERLCANRAIAKENSQMTSIRLTHYLTHALPEELERQIDATARGMAFLSGTGPIGTVCADCLFFARSSGRRRHGSFEARCVMFSRLSRGALGPSVPGRTPSCKYFEAGSAAASPT
jgi:hypothetical protein